MPPSDALQISPAEAGAALSPAQKRFNTLIRQLDKARRNLAAWQDAIAAFRAAHAQQLRPLQMELIAGLRQWVVALDAAIGERHWTKAERALMKELLCEAAGELLDGGSDDEALKALFDKHAEVDFESGQRERMQAMKGMAEAITGLDLGDDEIADDDELHERLHQSLQERAQAEQQRRDAQASRRRKSAAQQRREEEAQRATQSLREIYRKLASALHPDREIDPQQREEKTALMQRVNQAYERNDLLAMLELQLEIEQIDASHIAQAGEQRLKHYNKVLGEQLAELDAQIADVEMTFHLEFGVPPGERVKPQGLGALLARIRRAWQAELAEQQLQLRTLADVPAAKRWLKRERRERREADFDFGPF